MYMKTKEDAKKSRGRGVEIKFLGREELNGVTIPHGES
jgi:hypothetical protein